MELKRSKTAVKKLKLTYEWKCANGKFDWKIKKLPVIGNCKWNTIILENEDSKELLIECGGEGC